MNITQEQVSANHLKLIVNLDPTDYSGKVDEEIKTLSKKISLHGFRPGKVPPGITRKLYGNTILADELNKIISESLTGYIKEHELKVFGQPLPFQARQQQIDVQTPDTYSFGFELGIMPDFEIASLEKKSFERKMLAVTDEMINEEIDRLRSRFGEREYPETAGDEDILAGKFEELDENSSVKENGINSTSSFSLKVIKDPVEKEQLKSLKKEESTAVNIRSAFGNDEEIIIHHILHTDHHAAENMGDRFRFSLQNIIHVKPAEINHELFDKIYGEGKITSEEQMREKIQEEMKKDYDSFTNSKLDREIQNYLISETPIELPKEFLRRLLDENQEKESAPLNDEQFESSLRQVKWDLISEKLILENKLEANEDEMKQEAIKDVINYFGVSSSYFNENPDSLSKLVDSLLKDENNASRIRSRALNQKLHDLLRNKVQVEEKIVDEHEFFHH
ncbi:MAG: trigger factor [Chitinophagales bacterium]